MSENGQSKRPAVLTWWLAAGLVGADIGTSVFYSTGVLLPHVGFAAPFFILLVVATMWLFKTTYQEGCSVNPVNGGAYAMVLSTVGRRAGLAIGSLTILSYLATAVVSALSGAYYLSSLWPADSWPKMAIFAVAAVPVIGFGLLNLVGLKESTRVVFGIAAFHFVMLLVMDAWGLWFLMSHEVEWSRLWTGTSHFPGIMGLTAGGVVIGFASAFLGITGFESAAQIVEEIEDPVSVSIRRIYLAIVILVSITAPVSSLLALMMLDPIQIAANRENLMSGLAFVQGGRSWLLLLVLNAMLTLFAAVNTAYAGATGLMTTMGHQGNLPLITTRRWVNRWPRLQGYPYVTLPFMAASLVMMAVFPGNVDILGSIYGIAFLGVMISYCAGVVLTRLHHPAKTARAQYLSGWTVPWRAKRIPVAPILGGGILLLAEIILLFNAHEARALGFQLFLFVMLIMALYRLGLVEGRMVKVPDLRLGMGAFRGVENLPDDLPRMVVCIADTDPIRLVNIISYLLKKHASSGPIEIVLFHALTNEEPPDLFEDLERVISQQLEEFDFFANKDFVLTVKVLPGNLLEVLPEYFRSSEFTVAYVGTGHDPLQSERLREHLSNELDLNVLRLDESTIPKGPGVWFEQWRIQRKV